VCLTLPIIQPSQFGDAHAVSQQETAQDLRRGTMASPTMTDHAG
jgi:hypothetical protein